MGNNILSFRQKLTMDATAARNKILDEMTMAKSLASNHLRERQAAMERLRQWMSNDEEDFAEEDYLRIWKGLFYCMWMSDKPLTQEDLANEISSLIHAPPTFESSLLFIRTFYLTMVVEWLGIDHHRRDKFMMLVRRFLRQSFELIRKKKWAQEEVDKFAEEHFFILKFLRKGPLGLITHVKDIYVEELAKVSRGKVPETCLPKLLEPFARIVSTTDNAVLHKIAQKVFSHIIKQSEHGLEHRLKVVTWKRMGFPPNKFNKIKRVKQGDDEEEDSDADLLGGKSDSEIDEGDEEVLSQFQDLRAGGDVVIPTIDFNPQLMVEMLSRVKELEETTKRGKGRVQAIIQLFQRLVKGRYPLVTNQIRAIDSRKPIHVQDEVNKATERLRQIRNLKDSDAVNAFYAMKHKPVPSDDILLAGSGKRKRDWVEKHEYNDSIYLFGQNQVKNTSGVWTVTPKVEENGMEKDPAILKKQQVINAHDAIATSLRKKRKVDQNDKSEDPEEFPMEEENEDATDSPGKSKKKIGKQIAACTPVSNTSRDSEGSSKKKKAKKGKTSPKNALRSSTSPPPVSPSGSSKKVSPELPKEFPQVSVENLTPKEIKKLKKGLKGTPNKKSPPSVAGKDAKTPVNSTLTKLQNETPKSEKRRVEFVLAKNCSQDPKEYRRSLKMNPGIPFSAEKKPVQGVLKASPFPSPVNPFVKRSKRNKRLSF
nr:PREDICTED: ribosomal RNA processing protein 1 homolog isoform X1 [Bemisia tabaci]